MLGNRVWCLGHLDSFGNRCYTWCCLVKFEECSDILTAEGLKARTKSRHQHIHQFGSETTGMAAATSSEVLKPLLLDASLRVEKTVSIVTIVEIGLIN